jgi:hypothetical protein
LHPQKVGIIFIFIFMQGSHPLQLLLERGQLVLCRACLLLRLVSRPTQPLHLALLARQLTGIIIIIIIIIIITIIVIIIIIIMIMIITTTTVIMHNSASDSMVLNNDFTHLVAEVLCLGVPGLQLPISTDKGTLMSSDGKRTE